MKDSLASFIKQKRWLIGYTCFCIVFGFGVTFFASGLGVKILEHFAQFQGSKIPDYIEQEKSYIHNSLATISLYPEIRDYVQKEDVLSILTELDNERKKTGLTAFTITNTDGIALARSPVSANAGDNAFLTTYAGRLADRGIYTPVFGSGRNFSLTLGGGAPIMEKGEMIGTIFGGYWLTNEYASNFKKKYLLGRGQEILFYSKKEGITGNSVDDQDTRRKLRAYVATGSGLVEGQGSGSILNTKDKDYIVYNYPLYDDESMHGGILLLTPLPFSVLGRSFLFSLGVTILFFVSTLVLQHVTIPSILQPRRRRLLIFLLILSLCVFIAVWLGAFSNGKKLITYVDSPSFSIYNSTLAIRPSSGVYVEGYPQTASVIVYSGGERINVIELHLRFDPKLVSIDSVSLERSICSKELIMEKVINHEEGTITISCGIAEDAFSDVRGNVIDITFTPQTSGDIIFSFDEGTQVYAADGLGTEVLRSVTSAYYRIFKLENISGELSESSVLLPYSPTHENSSAWYNSKRISLLWSKFEGAEYRYELSRNATTTFINPTLTTAQRLRINAPGEGVFYFKIAPEKKNIKGELSIVKVKIDTTPPDIPTIRTSSLRVKSGDVVRFELSSRDELSGLQKTFMFNWTVVC